MRRLNFQSHPLLVEVDNDSGIGNICPYWFLLDKNNTLTDAPMHHYAYELKFQLRHPSNYH